MPIVLVVRVVFMFVLVLHGFVCVLEQLPLAPPPGHAAAGASGSGPVIAADRGRAAALSVSSRRCINR